VKLYVGVTDNDWYRFLRSRPVLEDGARLCNTTGRPKRIQGRSLHCKKLIGKGNK